MTRFHIQLSTGEETTVDGPDMTDQEIEQVNWASKRAAEATGTARLTLTRVPSPTCDLPLGSKPWWMGVDQWQQCRCQLPAGHDPHPGFSDGHRCGAHSDDRKDARAEYLAEATA